MKMPCKFEALDTGRPVASQAISYLSAFSVFHKVVSSFSGLAVYVFSSLFGQYSFAIFPVSVHIVKTLCPSHFFGIVPCAKYYV